MPSLISRKPGILNSVDKRVGMGSGWQKGEMEDYIELARGKCAVDHHSANQWLAFECLSMYPGSHTSVIEGRPIIAVST